MVPKKLFLMLKNKKTFFLALFIFLAASLAQIAIPAKPLIDSTLNEAIPSLSPLLKFEEAYFTLSGKIILSKIQFNIPELGNLQSAKAQIDLRKFSLFSGKLSLSNIELHNPQLQTRSNQKDYSTNLFKFAQKYLAPLTNLKPLTLNANLFNAIIDEKQISLQNLEVNTSNFLEKIEIASRIKSAKIPGLPEIKDFAISGEIKNENSTLEIQINDTNFGHTEMNIQIASNSKSQGNIKFEEIKLKPIIEYLFPKPTQSQGEVSGDLRFWFDLWSPLTSFQGNGAFQLKHFSISGLEIQSQKTLLEFAPGFQIFETEQGNGNLKINPNQVQISSLKLSGAQGDFEGSGYWNWTPNFSLDLKCKLSESSTKTLPKISQTALKINEGRAVFPIIIVGDPNKQRIQNLDELIVTGIGESFSKFGDKVLGLFQ